jgi:hypothetical protein
MQHRFNVSNLFKPEIPRIITFIPIPNQKNHARGHRSAKLKWFYILSFLALTQIRIIAVVFKTLIDQPVSWQTANPFDDAAWCATYLRIVQWEANVVSLLRHLPIDLPKQMVLNTIGFGDGQVSRYGHANQKRYT